jgi:hypothetical protein
MRGRLRSAPNTAYRLEFFKNQKCDPTFHGPGGETLGFTMVTTDGGDAAFFEVTSDAASLTPPSDSATYVNPFDPAGQALSAGDWVRASPGVVNSATIRNALDRLKAVEITVPVWDSAQSPGGAAATHHIVAFARVRLVWYLLPGQNQISVAFLGFAGCGEGAPPSTPTFSTNQVNPKPEVDHQRWATISGDERRVILRQEALRAV